MPRKAKSSIMRRPTRPKLMGKAKVKKSHDSMNDENNTEYANKLKGEAFESPQASEVLEKLRKGSRYLPEAVDRPRNSRLSNNPSTTDSQFKKKASKSKKDQPKSKSPKDHPTNLNDSRISLDPITGEAKFNSKNATKKLANHIPSTPISEVIAQNKLDTPILPTSPTNNHRLKRPLEELLIPSKGTLSQENIIEELRNKFQQLNMLRTTTAEALLEDYKKSSEERIRAAEKLIDSLRRENELLKKKERNAPLVPRLSDVSTVTSTQDGNFGSLITLYRNLCGLELKVNNETDNVWNCKLSGRQGEFTFDLCLDEESSQYCYTPTYDPNSPVASRLPAYLQGEISFDFDQIQLFFWRALNFLMSSPVVAASQSQK